MRQAITYSCSRGSHLVSLSYERLEITSRSSYFYEMSTIGVIEGFFGPQWPESSRKSYAKFLHDYGGDFYIYAPKQDPFLRKKWREDWPAEYLEKLKSLVTTFHQEGVLFGVGFSPFGLGADMAESDKALLERKLSLLNDLGIDLLGLFFDDMPITENLAETQLEALNLIRDSFHKKIIFCPSFYTPDPILDKVFGKRPEKYLDKISVGAPPEVALAWTGPKVISPEIDRKHLIETASLLKRKPFLWENLFANDGPKNCKFLKLKPFTGRGSDILKEVEGISFNLMNQPELSKILYLSSKKALEGQDPSKAFAESVSELCSSELSSFIHEHRDLICSAGLDAIETSVKNELLMKLKSLKEPAAIEITEWLEGKFIVGSECLTD